MPALPQLNDMALFVQVARMRSFRRAAEAMHMPVSTLSRRIAALEKATGLRLLHRTTRRLELTEAGTLYFQRSCRIVDEARLAHEQLTDMLESPSGLLRVSLPVDFATLYLAPLLVRFVERYPGISLELDLTPRHADLIGESLDVAIRIGELADSSLIARPLASISRHLYASPGYLARRGRPAHPAELSDSECLRMRSGKPGWVLLRGRERWEVATGGRFSANNVSMLRQLAVLNQGIALLADGIVHREVDAGRLVRILPEWQSVQLPVYALTETRLLPARTLRFIEFLREFILTDTRVDNDNSSAVSGLYPIHHDGDF